MGFTSWYSGKADEQEGAAKEKKSFKLPLTQKLKWGVALALIWGWGILVCICHWFSRDFTASGARQDSVVPSLCSLRLGLKQVIPSSGYCGNHHMPALQEET